jgi:hypothetical protein
MTVHISRRAQGNHLTSPKAEKLRPKRQRESERKREERSKTRKLSSKTDLIS